MGCGNLDLAGVTVIPANLTVSTFVDEECPRKDILCTLATDSRLLFSIDPGQTSAPKSQKAEPSSAVAGRIATR
jgi:hypothetical protein